MLTVAVAAVAAQTVDYSTMLTALFKQTDVNKDDALSYLEFTDAAAKLGIKPEILTLHNTSYQVFFNAVDADGSGTLTKEEFAGAIRPAWGVYKKPLIAAFTNGAGSAPTVLPTPSSKLSAAKAKVEALIVVAGKAADIYPGQRQQIVKYFADLAGVTPAEVVASFLDRKAKAGGKRARQLQTATSEAEIRAMIYLASDADAKQLQGKIPASVAEMQKVPAMSGLTVTETKVFVVPEWQVPWASMAAMAAVLLVASFVSCLVGKCWARRNREIESVQYDGCCSTGCCSFFAVRSWAFWQLVASLILIIACAFLFVRMQGLTKVLSNLVDIFLKFVNSTVPFISSFQQRIPAGISGSLKDYKHLIPLLPVAVIVPGALAFCCLFFSGACPMGKCNPGGYCCTKTLIFFGNLLLLLSLVFYSIFAGISLGIRYAPPQVKTGLDRITGMCEVTAPMIKQTAADNAAALEKLKAAGQDTSSYQATMDSVNELVKTVDAGCENILQMFVEFNVLFLPGACCIVAIVFGMYVNNVLCCSAGCCSANERKKQQQKQAGQKGVEFTTVSATSNDASYAAP